jgi:hypothetical protein
MTEDERTIIKGLDAPAASPEYRALRELSDGNAIRVSEVVASMIERGLIVQEEGELFATAAAVRLAYEN